jgi:hypothetical protein
MGYDRVNSFEELVGKYGEQISTGQLLTGYQAAELLGVSYQRVWQLMLTPALNGVRVMGTKEYARWYVWRSSVAARLAWLRKHRRRSR